MATDTRANRLAAPDYLCIRLVIAAMIASMFVRNHICQKASLRLDAIQTDFAPRAPSPSACTFSINLRTSRSAGTGKHPRRHTGSSKTRVSSSIGICCR
jgi:hypothetical protein